MYLSLDALVAEDESYIGSRAGGEVWLLAAYAIDGFIISDAIYGTLA